MTDIEQVKQTAAAAVNDAKADVAKVTSISKNVAQDAQAAEQHVTAAVKVEEGWIEKNPGKATLIAVALFAVIVALVAKACAA
jgi:t-SNARE complex subunit (syntaxin)